MTQNKKKGIAKKALSVSLVAAMLATSNVPAWASGFTAEEYGAAPVTENSGFEVENSDGITPENIELLGGNLNSQASMTSFTVNSESITGENPTIDLATCSDSISVEATATGVNSSWYTAIGYTNGSTLKFNASSTGNGTIPTDFTISKSDLKKGDVLTFSVRVNGNQQITETNFDVSDYVGGLYTVKVIDSSADAQLDSITLNDLKDELGDVKWFRADEQIADATEVAKKVKVDATGAMVKSARVGLVDAGAVQVDGTLETGRAFYTDPVTADDIGKEIAAELVLNDEGDTIYITDNGKIEVADATDITDWSVEINGQTYTKDGKDFTVAASDKYELGKVVLTLGDEEETVTIENAANLVNGELTFTSNFNTVAATIAFNNCMGINGALTLAKFETEGESLGGLISLSGSTLTYDPDFVDTGFATQIADLIDEGDLDYPDDYSVSVGTKADGSDKLTAEPKAGDKVYVKITGIGEYKDYEPIIKEYEIVAKDLGSLYVDQAKIDALVYPESGTGFDTLLENALKDGIFKYYDASDKETFNPLANAELNVSYTKDTKAGETVTVTITPKQGVTNFTGSKTFSFVAQTTALPSDTAAALNGAISEAAFTYDGASHSVNNLVKGNIGSFTRGEYTLTCVEEPSGSVKNAGDYTIVMNITSGAYAGQKLTATTKLTVNKANLSVFQYGKDVTINPIVWVDGLTDSTDLSDEAAPVLTFNGTELVEGVDYKVDSVKVDSNNIGANVKMVISAPADNAKCNFTGSAIPCTVGKLQARPLPELAEVPTQTYEAVKAAYDASTAEYALKELVATKPDGTAGTYADLMLDTDIDGDSVTMTAGTDYTVRFSKLPESGEGQVTLTIIGKGHYTGTVTKTINVTNREINASFIYNNSDILPEAHYTNEAANSKYGIPVPNLWTANDGATVANKVIVRNEDGENVTAHCDITYTNNRAAGTATIEATGKAGYDIHAVATFEILPQQKTATGITFNPALNRNKYYYTGEKVEPITESDIKITVKDGSYTLQEGTDFVVSYKNNINAATSSDNKAPAVVITGIGNYTFVQTATSDPKDNTGASAEFDIDATNIAKENVSVGSVEYAGGLEVTPNITVVNPHSGNELVKDKDYEVTLEDAVEAGTATATIKAVKDNNNYTFDGAVSGEIKVTFQITKKSLSNCDVIVENGVVTVKNGEITVPASEYTVKDNGDGTYTVTANADSNYTGSVTAAESVPETPGATVLSVSDRTTSTVTVNWEKVDDAEGYTIWYRSEYDTEMSRKIIFDGEQTSWTLKGLQPGTKYFFAMRSWVKDAEGNYIFSDVSPTQRGTTKPLAATIIGVTVTDGKIKVRLAGEAEGAEMYSMCYGDSRACFKENDFKVGIRTQYTTRTLNKTFEPGTYYVCVKSYRDLGNNKRVYGEWSNTFRAVVK